MVDILQINIQRGPEMFTTCIAVCPDLILVDTMVKIRSWSILCKKKVNFHRSPTA